MRQPQLELADIIKIHGAEFIERYSGWIHYDHIKVLQAIRRCRTAALGGHRDQCDRCGHGAISYNSCRNRHCPKCQASAREQWLANRSAELLPVPYFHVVFTLPKALQELGLQNKPILHDLLFRVSAQALLHAASDPRHLGAELGFFSVLHTWGQNLLYHPHIHCVIAGGGLSPDHSQWVHTSTRFLLPIRVLSRLFRGKFAASLNQLHRRGQLHLVGRLAPLASREGWKKWLRRIYKQDWVVYAKPPFGGPEHVLRYLARYTHRVAISNHRILSLREGLVRFRWRDYAHGNKPRIMTLPAAEFLRRFFLHVLPRGFVRIRHFGFLANRHRSTRLDRCRRLLTVISLSHGTAPGTFSYTCPKCLTGRMCLVQRLTVSETFFLDRPNDSHDTS